MEYEGNGIRRRIASYVEDVVGTPEFFWRVMERKLGTDLVGMVEGTLNTRRINTFADWKGVCLGLSRHNGDLSDYLGCSLYSKQKRILYSIAEISKSIDPEKEAQEEYKCNKGMAL